MKAQGVVSMPLGLLFGDCSARQKICWKDNQQQAAAFSEENVCYSLQT